jgi:hypothetical protein
MEIPDDRRIAEACSRGDVFVATDAAFAADLRVFASDLRARIAPGHASSGTPADKVMRP